MRRIFVVESHDEVLRLWREQAMAGLRVLHLDFHCDLRGLLINRKAQRAYHIWDRFPDVDEGNFLTHALLEGVVSGVRWVHDEPGGRKHDLKTVKYETDVTALIHRFLIFIRRHRGVPIAYEVVSSDQWTGVAAGEILDIDWDFFACQEYLKESIQHRIAEFWKRDFAHLPEHIYICYSPNYSHPTRDEFRRFVSDMATRFEAEVVDVSGPREAKSRVRNNPIATGLYQGARGLYHRVGLALRKRGVY